MTSNSVINSCLLRHPWFIFAINLSCLFFTTDVEDSSIENEGVSLRVTFSSIYQTSSTSLTSDMDRPRSGQRNLMLSTKKPEDLSASPADWSTGSRSRPISGSAKQKTYKVNNY